MTVRTKTITGKGTPTGLKKEVEFTYEVFNGGDVPSLSALTSFLTSRDVPNDVPDGVVLNSKGGLEWADEPEPEEGDEPTVPGERGKKEIPLSIALMLIRYFKAYNQQKARAQAFSEAANTIEAATAKWATVGDQLLKRTDISTEIRRRIELIQKVNLGTATQVEIEEFMVILATLTPATPSAK